MDSANKDIPLSCSVIGSDMRQEVVKNFNKWGALAAMITGPIVTIIWHNTKALSSLIYELVPAFFISLIVALVVYALTSKSEKSE